GRACTGPDGRPPRGQGRRCRGDRVLRRRRRLRARDPHRGRRGGRSRRCVRRGLARREARGRCVREATAGRSPARTPGAAVHRGCTRRAGRREMTDQHPSRGMRMDNSGFEELFGGSPLMAILRGMGAERSLAVSTTAWDLGIDVVELPIQTDEDIEALRIVAAAGKERGKSVGAGTVVSVEHVAQAASAGAVFTVSPGLDLDVVRASHDAGLLSMPGVATASEVQLALKSGLTWLKAFPASVLGPQWLTAMHGPFPQARFVTTGGMNASNAGDYLGA